MARGRREEWRRLAARLQASLSGQSSLIAPDAAVESMVEKGRRGRKPRPAASSANKAEALVAVDTERVSVEEAREAGAVHVGHRRWQQLGLNGVCGRRGLSA